MINRGEIEERFDPVFYSPNFRVHNKLLFKTLGELSNYILHPPEYPRTFSDEGIQLIRSQNVRPFGISIDERPVFFSADFLKDKKHVFAKKDDVLIVRSGVNAGDVAAIEEDINNAIIGADTLLCKCSDNVIPKFLQVYFYTDFGKVQITKHITGATNKHLNAENLKKVLVPNVILEIQRKAIFIFEQGLDVKRKKEAEAAALLASIDGYLLQELGITLPPPSEKKTYFLTHSNQISGNRFDPFYHQIEFEENKTVVKNGQYDAVPLKHLVEKLIKGKLPKDEEKCGDLKVIQINSINSDGHIDTSDLLTAKSIFTREQQMQLNDVLVVITGATIGKIAIWELEENEDYFLGGDIVKFQCFENINPQFIFAWLRCQNSQIEIKKNITGATNGHLSPSDIGNILIPLPPPEKQTEIANHISALRTQAKQLQQQAADELAHAKQQVEQLILGE